MFDVLNKITIDALIAPKSEGDRELAATNFLKLMPNDLVFRTEGSGLLAVQIGFIHEF